MFRFGRKSHNRTTLQIFTAHGDSLVDGNAEKGMDETLSDYYRLSFPTPDTQVAVYALRANGRRAVRRNGIEVQGATPPDAGSDVRFFETLRSVYTDSRARHRDRRNPANQTFARNQTYAIVGSIAFAIVCAIVFGLANINKAEETESRPAPTPTPVPAREDPESRTSPDGADPLPDYARAAVRQALDELQFGVEIL